jgi:NADH:flavin oxidoreductase / NADH oxidase family/NAD(P)-binding Rossmann-like domain
MSATSTTDPLLQPFQLRHLTLRNRLMSTSHEPLYSEDGMPKERYRLYHVEKAKGGIALTMTAGSAVVLPDSPPVFGNLLAYKDEIVPWLRRLADDCHAHGAAVMIQITHLGRRTVWNRADWLPVREAEIRPCVGATYCLDRIYEGSDAVCVHNAATGREATMPHVIARTDGKRSRIVVVGAGPGGLEAARVAAARGHEVVLFEAASQPGGQILLACRLARRKELIGIA